MPKYPAFLVKEASVDDIVLVNNSLPESDEKYQHGYFEEKCGNDALCVVAYSGEKPMAYVIGYDRFRDGSFYLHMMGVLPEYRGNGAFSAIMDYVEAWARKKGHSKLKLKTRNDRRSLLGYLVSHGYIFTEVRLKPNPERNRICMEKPL